jgi:Na+-driven multidrug efflux pump
MVFLFHRRQQFGLDVRLRDFLQIDTAMLADLVKLGVPMAIKSAAIQFSKLFVNSWINAYGVTVSAVAGVANKINSISNLFSNAINTAGASMVGQNIGAKKFRRVPKIILTAGTVTFSIAAVLSVLMLFFPRQIFGIFTDAKDVLDIAMEYMPVSILIFFGAASRAPMNALINGSGNYKINFATAIMDGVVMRIGLAMLLGVVLDFGYVGLWMGDALAGFTPFFIGLVYYFSGKWKLGRSGKAAR